MPGRSKVYLMVFIFLVIAAVVSAWIFMEWHRSRVKKMPVSERFTATEPTTAESPAAQNDTDKYYIMNFWLR